MLLKRKGFCDIEHLFDIWIFICYNTCKKEGEAFSSSPSDVAKPLNMANLVTFVPEIRRKGSVVNRRRPMEPLRPEGLRGFPEMGRNRLSGIQEAFVMANIHLRPEIGLGEQLRLMEEDTLYDVADDRDTDIRCLPDLSLFSDIRSRPASHTIPKMGVANRCIFNCAYCINRASNEERPQYCFEPKELARLSVEAAQKNHHGVFITSAIYKNADYTEELIIETLKYMRRDLQYKGYIHAKVMPGADPKLIETAGLYADRLSVNIEVAKSEGYGRIARQKNKRNILTPMGQISGFIQAAKWDKRRFATSQTTQLMAGSTGETDRTIMTLSKALYQKYRLKRVYYTAFQYRHPAKGYDLPLVSTPKWRTRRLYQADRLIKLYGFSPDEVTPEEQPDLPRDLDPKTDWAISFRRRSLYTRTNWTRKATGAGTFLPPNFRMWIWNDMTKRLPCGIFFPVLLTVMCLSTRKWPNHFINSLCRSYGQQWKNWYKTDS